MRVKELVINQHYYFEKIYETSEPIFYNILKDRLVKVNSVKPILHLDIESLSYLNIEDFKTSIDLSYFQKNEEEFIEIEDIGNISFYTPFGFKFYQRIRNSYNISREDIDEFLNSSKIKIVFNLFNRDSVDRKIISIDDDGYATTRYFDKNNNLVFEESYSS